MEIYTVHVWGGTELDLDSIFTSFEKAKEFVESDESSIGDYYEVFKWKLDGDEFKLIEKITYNKEWQEPKPVTQ